MVKIDFEKLLLDYIKFKEKLPHHKYIAPQQIPYFFNKLLEKQGLEYKDGQIVEIKQEPEETKPKRLFLKKDMSFEDGKLYRCTKIKSKDKIAYVDLEEVKSNPKEVEYSTMLQSIWGKVCELEGKLGDIYNTISKPYQPYQDIPQSIKNNSQPMQCWFPDGTCMNPYHDCVNCPRPYSSGNKSFTSTTTSIKPNEVMYDENSINNQEKKD